MSFTTRKPVTPEDLDETLAEILTIEAAHTAQLTVMTDWLARIDQRLAAIEAAVGPVSPQTENPLAALLARLVSQGAAHSQQLTQILTLLANRRDLP